MPRASWEDYRFSNGYEIYDNFYDDTKPLAPQINTSDLLLAGFRIENSAGRILGNTGRLTKFDAPSYGQYSQPFDIRSLDDTKFAPYKADFLEAETEGEAWIIKRRISQELRDKEIIERSGLKGIGVLMAAGLLDPVNFIAGAAGLRLAKVALNGVSYLSKAVVVKQALEWGISGAATAVVGESVAHMQMGTKTLSESYANIASATIISGILGGSVAKISKYYDLKKMSNGLNTVLGQQGVTPTNGQGVVMGKNAIPKQAQAGGKNINQGLNILEIEPQVYDQIAATLGNDPSRMNKIAAFAVKHFGFTPISRLMSSRFNATRAAANLMVTPQFLLDATPAGVALPKSAYSMHTLIHENYQRALSQIFSEGYIAHATNEVGKAVKLTKGEFQREVTKALISNNQHQLDSVQDVALKLRALLDENRDMLIKYNIIDPKEVEKLKNKGESYFPRMFSHAKMTADFGGISHELGKHFYSMGQGIQSRLNKLKLFESNLQKTGLSPLQTKNSPGYWFNKVKESINDIAKIKQPYMAEDAKYQSLKAERIKAEKLYQDNKEAVRLARSNKKINKAAVDMLEQELQVQKNTLTSLAERLKNKNQAIAKISNDTDESVGLKLLKKELSELEGQDIPELRQKIKNREVIDNIEKSNKINKIKADIVNIEKLSRELEAKNSSIESLSKQIDNKNKMIEKIANDETGSSELRALKRKLKNAEERDVPELKKKISRKEANDKIIKDEKISKINKDIKEITDKQTKAQNEAAAIQKKLDTKQQKRPALRQALADAKTNRQNSINDIKKIIKDTKASRSALAKMGLKKLQRRGQNAIQKLLYAVKNEIKNESIDYNRVNTHAKAISEGENMANYILNQATKEVSLSDSLRFGGAGSGWSKPRKIDINSLDILPWLEDDSFIILDKHFKQTSAQIALAHTTGDHKSFLNTKLYQALEKEKMAAMSNAIGNPKESEKIQKEFSKNVRDLTGIFDTIRGTYQHRLSFNPGSKPEAVLRNIRGLTSLTTLGSTTILSNVSELFNAMYFSGVRRFFSTGIGQKLFDKNAYNLNKADLEWLTDLFDMHTKSMTPRDWIEIKDISNAGSRIGTTIHKARSVQYKMMLMEKYDAFVRQNNYHIMHQEILRGCKTLVETGDITTPQARFLQKHGIGIAEAKDIMDMVTQYGNISGLGNIRSNPAKWTSQSAVANYRYALDNSVKQLNLSGDAIYQPFFAGSDVGKLMFQFGNWSFRAFDLMFVGGLQRGDLNSLFTLTLQAGTAAMAIRLKESYEGVPQDKRYSNDQLLAQAILNTGVGGQVGLGLQQMGRSIDGWPANYFGGSIEGRSVDADRNALSLFGPGVAKVGRTLGLAKLLSESGRARMTKADTKLITGLIPYRNIIGLKQTFQRAEEGINQKLGLDREKTLEAEQMKEIRKRVKNQ